MSRLFTGLAGAVAFALPIGPFAPTNPSAYTLPPVVGSLARRREDPTPGKESVLDPEKEQAQIITNTDDVFRLKGDTGLESTRFIFAAGPGGIRPTLVIREMPDGYTMSLQVSVGQIGVELSLDIGAKFNFDKGEPDKVRSAARTKADELLKYITRNELSLPAERDTVQMVGARMSDDLIGEIVALYKEAPRKAHFSRMPEMDTNRLKPENKPPADIEKRAAIFFRVLESEPGLNSNSPFLLNPQVVVEALAAGYIVSVVNPSNRSPSRVVPGEFAPPHQIVTCIGKGGLGKVVVLAANGSMYEPVKAAGEPVHSFGAVVSDAALAGQINKSRTIVRDPEQERSRWEGRVTVTAISAATVEVDSVVAAA